MCQYMLTISVRALMSVIPTVVCSVPWEDWGPSSTHLQHFYESRSRPPLLMSVGSFYIRGRQVRQYDLWGKDTSPLQSRPPIVDSNNIFQYDIETHLPYREVMMENDNDSYNGDIVADREWVVVVRTSVRGFFCQHSWDIPMRVWSLTAIPTRSFCRRLSCRLGTGMNCNGRRP